MAHSREIVQGRQLVGIDERPVYSLDVTKWGDTPTSIGLECFKWQNSIWTSVTSLCFPSGTSSVSGNKITLPTFVPQAIGDTYRVEIKFTVACGSILEAYAILDCER